MSPTASDGSTSAPTATPTAIGSGNRGGVGDGTTAPTSEGDVDAGSNANAAFVPSLPSSAVYTAGVLGLAIGAAMLAV